MSDFMDWINEIAVYERDEGIKEGIEIGDIIEKKNIARVLIQERFDNQAISEITDLSVAVIKGLR